MPEQTTNVPNIPVFKLDENVSFIKDDIEKIQKFVDRPVTAELIVELLTTLLGPIVLSLTEDGKNIKINHVYDY